MENKAIYNSTRYAKWPWFIIILCIVTIVVIIYQMSDLKKQNAGLRSLTSNQIQSLKIENELMHKEIIKFKNKADSLNLAIAPYLPYSTLIKSISLRDRIIEMLPFKPGDRVSLKSNDSLCYVISEIIMGGNTFNHYIRCKLKSQRGVCEAELQELNLKK